MCGMNQRRFLPSRRCVGISELVEEAYEVPLPDILMVKVFVYMYIYISYIYILSFIDPRSFESSFLHLFGFCSKGYRRCAG